MALKKKYSILSDYDYIENSVFQVFVTCDALSNAILLNYHYRCHPKIIAFNNKKYYKNKLVVKSKCSETQPLVFIDYKDNISVGKNTSYTEVKGIIDFAIKNKDKQIGVITPFVNQRKLIKESLKNKGVDNVTCGTVHAFQGDEKDVVLFSLAITSQTSQKTYDWLKCNSELINVATSRAADKLVLLSSKKEIERLHKGSDGDDLYELYQYIQSHGTSEVTGKTVESRALGIKPYSTETEISFMKTLNHAIDNINLEYKRYIVYKEVPISHVFENFDDINNLFYTGRFDFVVYEKIKNRETPFLAIELDGKEHIEEDLVKERDRKKEEICKNHNIELIRVLNNYARRYNYIKEILIEFFKNS